MRIAVLNQKGGAGKTTLSTNIAAEMARRGARVLLIDADPQGSALDWAAARQGDSLFPVIGLPRETIHKEIERLSEGYDHVVIDGPPRVTELARSAILASDLVLIPVQPSPYDIWAAQAIVQLVTDAQIYKEALKAAFCINRRITGTAIGRDIGEALAAYPLPVLSATVSQRVLFAEAVIQGKAVYEIEPNGPAAAEIEAVANEIQERDQ